MIDLLEAALLLAVLLTATGLAPALIATRSRTSAVALLPATGGLACALAASASLLTRTSMAPWLLALALAGWLAVLLAGRSGHLTLDETEPAMRVLVLAGLVAIVPVMLVSLPTTQGDARLIWWQHAAWFRGGGSLAREAMVDPAYENLFTHPAYPPLFPGVVAGVWHLGGAYDRDLALRVGQLFTAYAIAALGFFSARALALRGRSAAVVAGVTVCVAWSANAAVGLNGLVDLTWAVLGVTAAVVLLVDDTDRRTMLIGALFVAAAASLKVEGQVMAVILTALVAVRAGRQWRRVVPVVTAVGVAIGLWTLVVRPESYDRGDWSRLGDLATTGSEARDRLGATVPHLLGELGLLVPACIVTVVAVVVVGRRADPPLDRPWLLGLVGLGAAYTVVLTTTFVVRFEDIDFFLEITAYRAVIFVRLVLLVAVVLALALARGLSQSNGGQGEGSRTATGRGLWSKVPLPWVPRVFSPQQRA